MSSPRLSIIVPCYNESSRLSTFVNQLNSLPKDSFLLSNDCEWLFVDDGSSDNTLDLLNQFIDQIPLLSNIRVIEQKPNQGKGAAVKRGDLEATAPIRVFLDADLSTPLNEIEPAFLALQKNHHDLLIGSRHALDSKLDEAQPWYRVLLGRCFSYFSSLFHANAFSDTQCGFKMWTQSFSEKVIQKLSENRWSFDLEIILRAEKLSLSILEFPVSWKDVAGSKVSALKDGTQMLAKTVLFRAKHGSWLVWLVAVAIVVAGFQSALRGSHDLNVYEKAWRLILSGDTHIYELTRPDQGGYYYSPFFAIFFAPLAFFNTTLLRIAFTTLTFAIGFASWVLLKRLLRLSGAKLDARTFPWIVLMLFMSNSIIGQFQNGNVSLWILAFCVFSFYTWLYGFKAQAAFWLALAVNIKVFPLFLLLYFFWHKDYRFFVYFGLFSLAFLVAPALAVGWDTNIQMHYEQIQMLKLYGPQNDFGREAYQNLSAFLIRSHRSLALPFSLTDNQLVQLSQFLIASASTLFLFFYKQKTHQHMTIAFFMLFALMGQFTPTSWINHMGYCYFPIMAYLIFEILFRATAPLLPRVLTIISLAFFGLTAQGVVGKSLNDTFENWSLPTFGIGIMIAVFGIHIFKQKSSQRTPH